MKQAHDILVITVTHRARRPKNSFWIKGGQRFEIGSVTILNTGTESVYLSTTR